MYGVPIQKVIATVTIVAVLYLLLLHYAGNDGMGSNNSQVVWTCPRSAT